jgi:glycosyltransferase involved in cell wall biosynthesis
LTETIPFPLDTGGRIKTYNTLRLLSRRHEVHLHALVRERDHLRYERELAPYCSRLTLHHIPRSWRREASSLAWSQVTHQPFVVRRHFQRHVMASVRAACERHTFDAVYCDHLSMLEYGRRLHLPIVFDAHNVEFAIIRRHASTLGWSPLRAFAELEWRRVRDYERRWYPSCRLIYSVSEVDARAIRTLSGASPQIAVVPISVDVAATPVVKRLTSDPQILFVGGLHWPPNADAVVFFIKEVLPLIRRVVPNARLTVVGRSPEQTSRRLGPHEGVRFVGRVDDLGPYFESSRVMVVPIRSGSGMRVKILDGLARGLPVVTTSIGCEGIEVRDGTDVLVADTIEDFSHQVVRVLQSDDLAHALARSSFRVVRQQYDLSAIADTLDNTLVQALGDTAR